MNAGLIILPFIAILFGALGIATGATLKEAAWIGYSFWTIAALCMGAWIFFDRKNFSRLFSRKGSKYGASSGASILMVLLVLIGTAMLTTRPRFNKSIDVTRSGANTLSEQSVKMVDNLKEKKTEIEVIGFFQEEVQQTKFRGLLHLYEARGLPAKVSFINPQTDPATALANNITQSGTVIVKSGNQESRITTLTEEKFTNSLLSVMKDRTKKVYFTKGHGEGSLTGEDGEGFKLAIEELKNNKLEVEELSLLETPQVPEDADLVIIAGPKYDFKEEELKGLKDYVEKAKPLLVMLDAMVPADHLNKLLSDYGLVFNDDLLILRPDDPRASLLGQNNAIVSDFDQFSPITKDFAGKSSVALLMTNTRSVSEKLDNARSMKPVIVGKTNPVIIGVANVRTANDLKNITPDRVKTGALGVIGVATGLAGGSSLAENQKADEEKKDVKDNDGKQAHKEVRVIAVGSSQFATNLGAQRAENLNMFTNITNYLLQDEDFISIKPKDFAKSTIDMTSASAQLSLAFFTYIYPFLFLGFGLVHWLRRRRA